MNPEVSNNLAVDSPANRGTTKRNVTVATTSTKSPSTETLITKPEFSAKAVYLGEQIHLRSFLRATRLARQQLASVRLAGGGIAYLYRYGAVVFIDADPKEEHDFLAQLGPFVTQSYERPETEELLIRVDPQEREHIDNGTVVVRKGSRGCLEVVAAALSKSVALAQYELDVAANFDQIEPFAAELEKSGRGGRNMRQLLRHIGRALLNEHKMIARVEVTDRPELLWEHPELEQLYLRLEDEFELLERAATLDRKLDLISRTANTVLDLLQKRRSLRVEWYIVALFIFEIALSLYGLYIAR